MGDRETLSVGEFTRAMAALDRTITSGFTAMDGRLARVEETQQQQGEDIAVLKALRGRTTKDEPQPARRNGTAAAIGTFAAGALLGAVEIIKAWWTK